jgi:hypothetical protein
VDAHPEIKSAYERGATIDVALISKLEAKEFELKKKEKEAARSGGGGRVKTDFLQQQKVLFSLSLSLSLSFPQTEDDHATKFSNLYTLM